MKINEIMHSLPYVGNVSVQYKFCHLFQFPIKCEYSCFKPVNTWFLLYYYMFSLGQTKNGHKQGRRRVLSDQIIFSVV